MDEHDLRLTSMTRDVTWPRTQFFRECAKLIFRRGIENGAAKFAAVFGLFTKNHRGDHLPPPPAPSGRGLIFRERAKSPKTSVLCSQGVFRNFVRNQRNLSFWCIFWILSKSYVNLDMSRGHQVTPLEDTIIWSVHIWSHTRHTCVFLTRCSLMKYAPINMQVEPKLWETLNWRLQLLLENNSGIVYGLVVPMVCRLNSFEKNIQYIFKSH